MRKIILLMVMELLPSTAIAAGDCRVIEYPDHNEAICDGNAEQSPASQSVEQHQISGQEQNAETSQIPESEQMEVSPEMIIRNELARMHMNSWLKSRSK